MEKIDKILKAMHSLLPGKSSTERAPIACRSLKIRLLGHYPWPGRDFIWRLINLTIGVRLAHHSIRLTRETKNLANLLSLFQWEVLFLRGSLVYLL